VLSRGKQQTPKRKGAVKKEHTRTESKMYEVDVFIDSHILEAGKTKNLGKALHILADNVDLLESAKADNITVFDIDNDFKVVARIDRFDLSEDCLGISGETVIDFVNRRGSI
jgi:hypothetical protein